MKNSIKIAAFLLLVFTPQLALAHGGGLDSFGCHRNRKVGGYHCHRGTMKGQSFSSKEEMLKIMKQNGQLPKQDASPK